jgi:hypothetical protein
VQVSSRTWVYKKKEPTLALRVWSELLRKASA